MIAQLIHRALCSASILLALQLQAQSIPKTDSLALQALNRSFHILPLDLSLDLTLGEILDSVPNLKGQAAGYDRIVLGRYQSSDSVKFSLVFMRDSSGGLFGGFVTRHARIETIQIAYQTNSSDRAALFLPQFSQAMSSLGAPQFCVRDTVVNDPAQAIVLRFNAMWRRGDVTMLLEMTINVVEPLEKYRVYAPRFYAGYDVRRSSDTLAIGTLPTQHDSPCLFTNNELREHAEPLDSVTYDAWRRRLKPSPE